jgi:hypothetical protein
MNKKNPSILLPGLFYYKQVKAQLLVFCFFVLTVFKENISLVKADKKFKFEFCSSISSLSSIRPRFKFEKAKEKVYNFNCLSASVKLDFLCKFVNG